MDTHVIRLRGGWECEALESPGNGPVRLSLPVRVGALPTGRLRLIRRFNRPPRDVDSTVVLRLSRCIGIHSIVYNGQPVGPISPDHSEFELRLGHLAPRNELMIEAEPPRGDAEWGVISLTFASGSAGMPGPVGSEEAPGFR